MKPSIEMSEEKITTEVSAITMKIAKLLRRYDRTMTGAVLGNLIGMYLWTLPPDKREPMAAAILGLAVELLEQMSEQTPPDVRAPN